MKMAKILNDIEDLLDGEGTVGEYDVILNIGRKADNVSITCVGKTLRVDGWKGHKPAGVNDGK